MLILRSPNGLSVTFTMPEPLLPQPGTLTMPRCTLPSSKYFCSAASTFMADSRRRS